jgi:hypothetical protein
MDSFPIISESDITIFDKQANPRILLKVFENIGNK